MTAGRARHPAPFRKVGAPHRTIVAGALALAVAIGIGRFAYTPILPMMQEEIGGEAAAGALAASNNLGYLVGALLAAVVPADRPRNKLLLGSLVTVSVTTAAVALSTSFTAWMGLRFVTGLAAASVFVLASSVVLEELSRRGESHFSGRLYAGVGFGIALSGFAVMPVGALLSRELAWRADWLLLGAIAAALAAPCWSLLPERRPAGKSMEDTGRETEPKVDASGSVAGAPIIIFLLGAAYFLEGGGYIVTGTFLLVIVEGLPGLEGTGPVLWVMVGLAAAPSTLLWARVAARTGRPLALVIVYGVQAIGVGMPAISSAPWAAAASAVLFGGTILGVVSLILPYARIVVGTGRASLVIGGLTAVYGVGQVLGPPVGAALAGGPAGFAPALLAAAAIALGGTLMVVVVLYEARSRIRSRARKGAKGLRSTV